MEPITIQEIRDKVTKTDAEIVLLAYIDDLEKERTALWKVINGVVDWVKEYMSKK